jgi:multidrug transporter EmrE-like cation transporter
MGAIRYYTVPVSIVTSSATWLISERMFPPASVAAAPGASILDPHRHVNVLDMSRVPVKESALSSALAVTTQVLSTLVASTCSSLMYAVLSQAKTVATTLLGAAVFQSEFTKTQAAGASICLFGAMCYAFLDATSPDKASANGVGEVRKAVAAALASCRPTR